MYSFDSRPELQLVRARLWGFWSLEDVEHYARDLPAAVAAAMAGPTGHLSLVDLLELLPQSQAVVARLQAVVFSTPVPARRLAVACGSSLLLRQIGAYLRVVQQLAFSKTSGGPRRSSCSRTDSL